MKVLIACEESQRVCDAFREKGNIAYSCDILPCSGNHPYWHIQGNVLDVLNGNCEFRTQDGVERKINDRWDLIIAHPPCTYLTVTGNRWFNEEKYGNVAKERKKEREKAFDFFMKIWNADCEKVVIENPIGYVNTRFRKPDQIIHPYYFAERENDINCERKATCLWMRGVKPLNYEIKYQPIIIEYKNGKGTDSPWHTKTMSLPKEERSRLRSQTFPGIAKAMAEQWGNPTEKGGGE